MSTITIRRMSLKDLTAVLEIERANFPQPWTRRHFLTELERRDASLPLVAVIDSQIVGYSVCWFIADEMQIATVSVHPQYHGQRIGETLLRKSLEEAHARGCRRAFLEVRRSNRAAIHLYQRLGFHPIGSRPRFYGDEDALLMSKRLTPPESNPST